jgi:2-iminobutanoate/2-iminopropanoate deaminase
LSIKRIRGATIVGDLVFTSGTGSREGDVETQIRTSLARLEKVLEEAGTSFEHIVKATVYLADIEDRPKYLNPIWAETFGDNRPSRTCVQAYLGPDMSVEIELVAAIPR